MKKQSIIKLALVIVLAGTVFLGYFFKASKRAERVLSTPVVKTIGAKLDIDNIGTIHINGMRFDSGVDEGADFWEYKDMEKNLTILVWKERIEEFLNDLKGLPQGRLVEAEAPDLAKYGLAESDEKDKVPYTVSLESKTMENILTFRFSQSTNPTYAQFRADKAVYKVASTLHSALSSEIVYWLDTRIFSPNVAPIIEPSKVASITITSRDGKKMILLKEGGAKKKNKKDEDTALWTLFESSATLDGSKVSRYLNSLVEAQAKDFSDVEVVDSMQEAEVLVKLEDGREIGLTLYAFAENFYVKKKVQNPNDYNQYTFLITKYLKDTLFPTSEESFIAEPTDEPEPEAENEEKEEGKDEKKDTE